MNNENAAAFPLYCGPGDINNSVGLTKRELFAAMAMGGFCMNALMPSDELPVRTAALANLALQQADALLKALEVSASGVLRQGEEK